MQRLFRIGMLVFALFSAGVANAAFVIDYTGSDKGDDSEPSSAPITKKKLLLDKSVNWAVFVGSCRDVSIPGSGLEIPLGVAFKMILPDGWKVYADDDVNLDGIQLTWKNGDIWTKLIADAAERNKIRVLIDCSKEEISFSASPDLGLMANAAENKVDSIGEIPEASLPPPAPVATVTAEPYSATGANQKNNSGDNNFPPQSIEPYGNETIHSFMTRYAKLNDFDRVVYRTQNINKIAQSTIEVGDSKKPFNLSSSLRERSLLALTATDSLNSAKVLVVTDEPKLGNRVLKVFSVNEGLLSENATRLSSIYGLAIGSTNQWPIDTDYRVQYSYDIVVTDALDAFTQLFKAYPVQARIIQGGNNMTVVKRTTSNRQE